MHYQYRTSALKGQGSEDPRRDTRRAIILSAQFKLGPGEQDAIKQKMEGNSNHRKQTQPPGASMGSMFKNPPGDYAGRLIEAAGLKGTRVGNVEISSFHANFFVNLGNASASNIVELIHRAREQVAEKFGVRLDLEIELVGEFTNGLASINSVKGES
jgi:UDP-N-acetylmuramate dehydrogenase